MHGPKRCTVLCSLITMAFASVVYCGGDEAFAYEITPTRRTIAPDTYDDLRKLFPEHGEPNLWKKCSKPSHVDTKQCLYLRCFSEKTTSILFELTSNSSESEDYLENVCPSLLQESLDDCLNGNNTKYDKGTEGQKSKAEIWGFGFLFMTAINLSSLTGVVILPFTKRPFFKWLLQFLISLAAGTLASCAVFFLIPDAFAMLEHEPNQEYVWKAAVVMLGIYVFFNVERLLKMGVDRSSVKKKKKLLDVKVNGVVDGNENDTKTAENDFLDDEKEKDSDDSSTEDSENPEGVPGTKKKRHIKPVAWMIIIGDSLHRCVDGMSVGAAFSLSFFSGVSLSIAIMLEEFPHGLGDFAMLLKAGMSRKQAVIYNLVAAAGGFIGVSLGITIGENIEACRWVFAVAAGMFLYVGLVDMLSDVNQAVEEEPAFQRAKCTVFILQNTGILVGGCAMLLLAAYSGNITFD